jgi:short-subunit dehydrogenase
MKNKIIILGISSDIGKFLAKEFAQEGCDVVGTFNNVNNIKDIISGNIKLIQININNLSKKKIIKLKSCSKNWDVIISCLGSIKPLGNYFENSLKDIKKCFDINFFSNIELIKNILKNRKKKSHIFFFSGSGSNGPSNELSAYCLSKILLIKSAELISEEYSDINCTAIGPGFIDTKIHNDLKKKKKKYNLAYKKYLFLKNQSINRQKDLKNIFKLIKTCIKNPKLTRGRNFSSKYDNWRNNFSKYKKKLKNLDTFKLRRCND